MVNLELDIVTNHSDNCSLDKSCFNERVETLQKKLFSKSISLTKEEGKIKMVFNYSNEIITQIRDFIIFEKACCNDFIIDFRIDMKNQLIGLELT